MRTIEIEIIYPDFGRPSDVDWVTEDQLQETLSQINSAGLKCRIVGAVSWQRQLARMESNPDAL